MEEPEAIDLVATLISFALIVFIIALGVVLLMHQFRKKLHQQQITREALKTEHQRQLLQNSIQVQENERERIAKDLHDELGAVLSMSKMWLMQLERSENYSTEKLKEIREMVEMALASSRRISHELMPLQLQNLGLKKSLESLAHRTEEATNISFHVTIESEEPIWEMAIQLELYRIYSELIHNTIKHAKANNIAIHIHQLEEHYECIYTDDGIGLPSPAPKGGLGLTNLEGRINALHGKLEFPPLQKRGFSARFYIPHTHYQSTPISSTT